MKKIVCIIFVFLLIPTLSFASRGYERDFSNNDGSGFISLEITDSIIFTITVTSGSAFFCAQPESIVQGENEYYIDTTCFTSDCIEITWANFDGCGDLSAGAHAIGTMSTFPVTFNILDGFRLYCGVWNSDDYFDVEPYSSTTTSTTDNLCPIETLYGVSSRETKLLRSIRDDLLCLSPEGQEIIKMYYQWSPVIVKAMEDQRVRNDIRVIFDGIVSFLSYSAE